MPPKSGEDEKESSEPKEKKESGSEKAPPKAKKVEGQDEGPPEVAETPEAPPPASQPPPPPYNTYQYNYQGQTGIDFSPTTVFIGVLIGAVLIIAGLFLTPGGFLFGTGFGTGVGVYYLGTALMAAGTLIGFIFAFCGAFFGKSFNNYHRVGLFIVAAAFLI